MTASESGPKSRVSNGLSCERKSGFFEQVIEEDDELSHHGGEGYFLGFTGSDQEAQSEGQVLGFNI